MTESDNFIEKMMREERKRIKLFQNKLISKWYWFFVFSILGLLIGYFISYYSPENYRAESTILVQNESNSIKGKEFFQDDIYSKGFNIQDHIGVLKSHSLSHAVVNNLNWRTSWYQQMMFYNHDLYGNEPFEIQETGFENPTNIPVFIQMISDSTYTIRVEHTDELIGFEQKGEFGKVFQNDMFQFILEKKSDFILPENSEYFFEFNNSEHLALELSNQLDITLDDMNGNLIIVKMIGQHSQRLVDFVNGLSREYIYYCLNEKNRFSVNTVKFIDMQLDGVVDSLTHTGNLYSDFQSKTTGLDPKDEAEFIRLDLKKLEEDFSVADRKVNYYKSLNKYLNDITQFEKIEKNLQDKFGEESSRQIIVAPSISDFSDPVLNNLVLKLDELTRKKEVLSYSAKENEPNMLILEKEINHIRQSLYENLTNSMIIAENDLTSISRRLEERKKQINSLPKLGQNFTNIKRRYDLNNDLYNFLLKKRAEAEIIIASNVPNSQIVDKASIMSVDKVGPKFLLNMLLGAILGLLIPFLFIKTSDYFDNTIENVNDLESETTLPVLGVIMHNKHRKDFIVSKRPNAGITETFRSLRTDLEQVLSTFENKVVTVQSVMPGEGKSFISVNLAAVLALNHRKVLLVETDMRKPRLSKMFGCASTGGMSQYLQDEDNFNEIIYPTQIENLSFIPAGTTHSNPAELLANGKFNRFMDSVRRRFNYIIMDSAPVSIVTDGLLTGKYADLNLFVLRQRYSNKKQINYINKISEKGSIKNISLILNDFKYNGFDFLRLGYKRGYYNDNFAPNGKMLK